MGTALSILLPLLPDLITAVEKLFTKAKSGPTKLTAVQSTLQTLWNELISAGIVPKGTPAPSSDTLLGAIEATLTSLKSSGTITTGSGTKPPTPSYTIQGTLTPPSK